MLYAVQAHSCSMTKGRVDLLDSKIQLLLLAPSEFLLGPSGSEEMLRNVLVPLWQALFGMSGAWLVCFLLTYFDVLPTSPDEYGYQARTDINLDAVSSAECLTQVSVRSVTLYVPLEMQQ